MLTNKNNSTSWTNDFSLANRLKCISNYLSSGSRKVFKNISNDFEQSSFNVLTLISLKGPLSIKQISYYLKVTHPAIIQIVKKLIKKKFVVKYDSLEDKRKTIVSLTDDGKKAYESIKGIANKIEQSYQDIINEVDPKFLVTLSLIEDELESKGILERVSEKSKEEQIKRVEIVRYQSEYKNIFKEINLEWLNKYFEVEEEDTRALEDPESYYIKNGGEIFFAIMDNNVAGTCAVKKINRKLFELSKMAVSELYQGKQIGKKLALTAIGFAYEKGAHKINLETSPKLKAAINLYKKLGFEILPEMYPTNYKRTLFEMELKLR
jgi:DNA-binding MarR family transcriptional regulator/ribosomal protein S18 acetylase RimI-like enzyme